MRLPRPLIIPLLTLAWLVILDVAVALVLSAGIGPLAPLDPQSLARAFAAIDLPAIEAAL